MLFGTSGVRGLYDKDVDEVLAMKITNLFADQEVVVARDTRTMSEMLAFAAIAGVLGKGQNAFYLTVASTPTLALATQKYKCKGIMITASHNPPEYAGLKFYENGKEISRKAEQELEMRYNKEQMEFCIWKEVGQLKIDNTALEDHKTLIKKLVNTNLIQSQKPKVVVDANGAGAVLTADLLSELGCEVISINNSLSDFCSSRNSEPNAENLKGLAAKVREMKADLGIGHDGDADRTAIIDEKGEFIPLDVALGIMIKHEIESFSESIKHTPKNFSIKIITTVETSLCVREAIENEGAEALITSVGSLHISNLLEKEKAIFGGEPCGEYVFGQSLHVPDGILAAAKFVEIFCGKGKFSELRRKYAPYPILREKFKCDNSKKYEIVKRISGEIKIAGKRNEEDGLRVDEQDGWFLIRASGTEPCIRLTVEYKTKNRLDPRVKELRELIMKYL